MRQLEISNQDSDIFRRSTLRFSALEFSIPAESERGFTLLEMVATMAIMLILAGAALPLARTHAQRLKEQELQRDLREMRAAIDHYKDLSDQGLIPVKPDTFGYPPDLQTLVDGVSVKGIEDVKYKFLRRIPVDPMTGQADWVLRSMQDDPDAEMWGGQNVYDVHSRSDATALDGTTYSSW
jgi:general secretion pathway protein G